ncbi:MAG: hypothetical protein NUK57_04405 [Gudongella sp.]|nr:hypothetical protein [Gudongella sp.]
MISKYEDLLNELVILEKKYLLYSRGHDFVNMAALDILRTIGEIHASTPSITIVDNGFNLVINGVEFNDYNIKASYLSQLLGSRGIKSLTLLPGVGFSSLMDFLYLLNSIPNNSKLLYHTDIQYAIHNIDSIQVEEIDYGSLRYGYSHEGQEESIEENNIRTQLYESLKTLDSVNDSCGTEELIDIALEEMSEMSQTQVTEFLQGLSDDAVSEIIARIKARENSISPSLLDLLIAMDSARKLAGEDSTGKAVEEISSDQLSKLVEREAYELYVSEDYRMHLRSLLSHDIDPQDGSMNIDMFDKNLINRTILMALVHLTRSKLDDVMQVSFVDSIHGYIDEFIDCQDWEFIHSISDEELVSSYLKQDSTVLGLSEATRGKISHPDSHLMEVIKVSGPKNIDWLMDAYVDEDDLRSRRVILGLIQEFQETAAILAVKRYLGDPTQKISLLMPIIKDHLDWIPRELSSGLFTCDSPDAKLLAMRILLTEGDEGVKKDMERIIGDGRDELVMGSLHLVRDFGVTELMDTIVDRITTFYIDESSHKYIVKAIDTISWLDSEAFRDLEKSLMGKRLTLSPKRLRSIKKYLKGVSHDHISR